MVVVAAGEKKIFVSFQHSTRLLFQVFKISAKNQVKFGLVIENFEAINSTDDEFEDSLKKGEIRVVWHPDGKEEILPETNVSSNTAHITRV